MDKSKTPSPGLDAYHRERSKCLDAFAAVEEEIVRIMHRTGVKISGEPFGKKLQSLRKCATSTTYSIENKSKVDKLIVEIEVISEIRNDLVHARLRLVCVDGNDKACFINARECTNGTQSARLFTLESLRQVTKSAGAIAGELKKA